ncbi:26S proteasome complex subunit SEM1-like isoform X2 [Maniola jurtina]|uniref:26S proteasome complex subunit SEM1-like isoform X2 n=1 Tax=Maniola jurtina TaxID=191418 RepID=UPI001E68DC8E|nr:26S proteasome complex subunit SEM1-like isoform X2 [Maniola jurtina]
MADKQKVDLGLLEEDDEFEEFPTEHWGTEDADDADVSVWEDNWEDDIVQDDFSQQLKQQLEKLRQQEQQRQQNKG